jgi:hypothetical protein
VEDVDNRLGKLGSDGSRIIRASRQGAGTDFSIAQDGRIAAVYLFFDQLP